MILKNISAFVLTALIAVSFPGTSNAYFTQAQTQTKLTPITALYTITYSFGLSKNDLYLPLTAERNIMHGESDTKLGYTIREDKKDITNIGDTASFIYSKAEIRDGMYFVPKGTKASFTLVALLRTQEDASRENYLLLVENLPFQVDIDGDADTLQARGLNPSELQYYTTDDIYLNDNPPVDIQVTSIEVNPPTINMTPNGK